MKKKLKWIGSKGDTTIQWKNNNVLHSVINKFEKYPAWIPLFSPTNILLLFISFIESTFLIYFSYLAIFIGNYFFNWHTVCYHWLIINQTLE